MRGVNKESSILSFLVVGLVIVGTGTCRVAGSIQLTPRYASSLERFSESHLNAVFRTERRVKVKSLAKVDGDARLVFSIETP